MVLKHTKPFLTIMAFMPYLCVFILKFFFAVIPCLYGDILVISTFFAIESIVSKYRT